jgi:pullulanase/glycogen debranching enzyme
MGPDSRTLAIYLSGASQHDADLYLMINSSDHDRTFVIQEGGTGEWQLAFNTGLSSPEDFVEPADRNYLQSKKNVVAARSIVGLIRGAARPQ